MSGPNDGKPRKYPKKPRHVQGGSAEASRLAVLILEVLAGGRSPLDAAKTMGVRLPRYYQLETRALQGLIAALEPRPKVRQPSPEGRIARLEKALGEARRESLRQQALVRAAQRSLGIKPPPPEESKPPDQKAPGHRKRRPAVRALKAARRLARDTPPTEPESVQQEDQDSISRQPVSPTDGDGAPGGMSTTCQGAAG
jgi:hypothetical protein